ncbi:unnamed protein product [Phaedon cochleariae]|uniref:Autophagy-related protein 13 n=1 Tax=Phaedon cochleariae TaxID=80249 RepID=A0A9N9SGD3_PHACE|nr:unnamed protein product [Phaedon cochleariae]
MIMKLNSQEKKELDKFTKFLALKSTQIIVQSRLGEKVSTACKPQTTGTDWSILFQFNLNINDIPEVLVEGKKILNGEVLSSRLPLCIEISLRTVEGDHMVLETWYLSLSPEQCDPTARIIHTIYNHMGILLKSLVSVSRVIPAYKLSRRQGPESFVICYRMYMGEPLQQCLGEGFKNICVGQVCTPLGTFALSVSYRTKMTISPTQTGRDNSIMLKSDHFNTHVCTQIGEQEEKDNTSSLSDIMKIGAFADLKKKTLEYDMMMPSPPFSKIFKEKLSPNKCPVFPEAVNKEMENSEKYIDSSASTHTLEARMDSLTMVSTNDDFIMVDLKTPFANTNEKSELGKFYREWQSAPPLQAFVDVTPPEELDVAKQLATFESSLNEYDSVVQSLCSSVNNS